MLLVQVNCSGAVADAKTGFKAEMDAPGWQREREEAGRGRTGLRGAWQAAAGAEGSIPGACRQQEISWWPDHHLKAGTRTLRSM